MCLGIPAQIVALHDHPHLVTADVFGARRQINVGLLEDGVAVGDWVLLHVGFAVNKLGPEELERVQASLRLVGNADDGDDGDSLAGLEAELAERSMRRQQQEEVDQWV